MSSVIFNGATISFDAPVDLLIIRGKLVIDTKSYGQPTEKKTKPKAKVETTNTYNGNVTKFLRQANLRVGKKLLVKANNKKTIYGAYKKLGYTASIEDTKNPIEFMVTCLR